LARIPFHRNLLDPPFCSCQTTPFSLCSRLSDTRHLNLKRVYPLTTKERIGLVSVSPPSNPDSLPLFFATLIAAKVPPVSLTVVRAAEFSPTHFALAYPGRVHSPFTNDQTWCRRFQPNPHASSPDSGDVQFNPPTAVGEKRPLASFSCASFPKLPFSNSLACSEFAIIRSAQNFSHFAAGRPQVGHAAGFVFRRYADCVLVRFGAGFSFA